MLWPLMTRGFYTRHGRAFAACFLAGVSTLGFATQNPPVMPPNSSSIKTPLLNSSSGVPLTQARYLSNGVYLGSYPGFIAPGHSLTATSFVPEGAKLSVRFIAQPYQGQMPIAKLLINGQLIAELDEVDNQIIEISIPQALTGKLAEIAINFGDYEPEGGIKLDTVRTPMNIPLLRIHALELIAPDNERRLTNEL